MSNELWNKWSDVHNSPDQQKRIASAKKSACTPVSVDQSACTGTFKGSSGTHTTSLDHCSCVDFNRRKLPCKHMYRLAMELGAFQTDFDSDKSAIVEPIGKREKLSKTIALVETLTADQQKLLLSIARRTSNNAPTTCIKWAPDIPALVDANLIEIVPEFTPCLVKYKKAELFALANSFGLTPDKKLLKPELISYIIENAQDQLLANPLSHTVVRICKHIRRRQVHMYLHRKWDTDDYYDGNVNPCSTPLLETILPDDAVTDLLIQYGYYTPPKD